MRRISWFFLLALLLTPRPVQAIQLHWSGGGTALSFTEPTRATLEIVADPAEVTLPGTWRFQWVADSSGIQVATPDSATACLADVAKVSAIDQPQTPADSAANEITAHFCSDGASSATTANFVLDLVGGSHGKLKVVALAVDSVTVLESNEVTYNGGLDGDYAPAILLASSEHVTEQLSVTLIGSDLAGANVMTVGAADHLWSVPLSITSTSDTLLTATATVPSYLPASVVTLDSEDGSSATTGLLPDRIPDPDPASVDALPDTVLFRDPNIHVYPKDFAFNYTVVPAGTHSRGLFHLIYIRHNKITNAEASLGHAWSDSLRNWRVDTLAFLPNSATWKGVAWNSLHVWAPSLQKVGNLYYMFYTGVDASNNQRIGYVTTSLLDTTNTTWSAQRTMVLEADSTSWADPTGSGPYFGAQQFRDPFVMEDPDTAGQYIMLMVGQDLHYGTLGPTVVGVAKNRPGTLERWRDFGRYVPTDSSNVGVALAPIDDQGHPTYPILESPLVMRDSLSGKWRIFFANARYNTIGSNSTWFLSSQSSSNSPADTTASHWPTSGLTNMYTYLGSDNSLLGWQAAEHLQVGSRAHFFAAYQGDGIGITQAHWDQGTGKFFIQYPSMAAVGGGGAVTGPRFYLARFQPAVATVRFGVESPTRVTPCLVVYDLAGRKVQTVSDQRVMQGRREYLWDRRDARGTSVPSGMYFARLTGVGAPKVLRVPIVR